MNVLAARLLTRLKSLNYRLKGIPPRVSAFTPNAVGQAASDLIRDRVMGTDPCVICRFGKTELETVCRYLDVASDDSFLHKSFAYIRHEIGPFWWDDETRVEILNQSGFFPGSDENLDRFSALMLSLMPSIDVLATWLPEEHRVADRFTQALLIPLPDLEPYFHADPWSAALAGKTVLVIHPFEESIRSQYQRRERIFPGTSVLPEFELKTFKTVQSVVGTSVPYSTWFDALEWMQDEIAKIDFEVAIIGAGAYGMPLAAHVKHLGKKAVHLGGATQLLFGIRGKRWDDRPKFQPLFNDAWVHPLQSEVPENYRVLEQGAYW